MIRIEQLMPFKKFAQSILRLTVHDKKRPIKGVFKDKKTGQIIRGDDFMAEPVGMGSSEEAYRAYLKWWNVYHYEYENERVFMSAKWDDEEDIKKGLMKDD